MNDPEWGAWARAALRGGKECPDEEALRAWSEQEDPDSVGAVAAHVAACARCQFEIEEMKAFLAEPDGSTEEVVSSLRHRLARWETTGRPPAAEPRPASDASWLRLWPVAAALLVVVGGGLWLLQQRAPEVPVGAGDVLRGQPAPLPVQPAGMVADAPERLAWDVPAGAEGPWQVRLETVDGQVLWTASTEESAVPLPEAIRSALAPGSRYLWRISGAGEAGAEAVATFSIALPGPGQVLPPG